MSASMVDAMLRGPAVVYGSLPPSGRDLDLLLDAEERDRLRGTLLQEGWAARGRTVARFAEGTAYAVDLVDVTRWAPGPEVAGAIVAQSVPIDGYERLRAPAPHHRVLVLARRFADGMRLDEPKRSRLAAFADSTWDDAAAEAPAWGLVEALASLRAAYTSGSEGPPRPLRRRVRRPRPRVVSLSGVDGAGKSTQAEMLHDALEALGYDVAVEWSKIARNPGLKLVSAPARFVLNAVGGRTSLQSPTEEPDPEGEVRNYPDGPPPPPDVAKLVRQRSRAITAIWTLMVAWANAGTHRRAVRGHRGVVICDRYVLDSMAHLRYRYGLERRFRPQSWVIRLGSPRTARAFFLDIPPPVARARKPEQYTTADLVRLRQCYVDAAARLDVVTVDPTEPPDEVAALIAREAWQALG